MAMCIIQVIKGITVLNFVHRKVRRLVQLYGTSEMKQRQWDREFKQGRWDYITDTAQDPLYAVLHKYARNKSILDLGCGSGNTANELAEGCYLRYCGIDISETAIQMAKTRTWQNGRAGNVCFFQLDISSYVPAEKYGVILFRESIYYLPFASISRVLNRYNGYIEEGGVFVARISSGVKSFHAILEIIEHNFQVVERRISEVPPAIIVVFRQTNASVASHY